MMFYFSSCECFKLPFFIKSYVLYKSSYVESYVDFFPAPPTKLKLFLFFQYFIDAETIPDI